ncbi:MAG: TatD family hydrolase [Ruminococcus sp.]|jgi:TatD DNase family protein|nr:TatD family hydrolase [Ruminococcus sp.]
MKYTDTHAHYDDPRFDGDRDSLLKTLHETDCDKIFNIGCTLERTELSRLLADEYDFISFAAGIHPSDAPETQEADVNWLNKIESAAKHPKCIGIGEIGLDFFGDYYIPKLHHDIQVDFFRRQIELAIRINKPVIIHSRDAAEETVNILRDYPGLRGQVHCFSYSKEIAEILVKMGFYISLTGVITFKNAKKAVETAAFLPTDRLLLETDCPYMSPEPLRGKRNDSGNIRYIIKKLAEIKGMSEDEIIRVTNQNVKELFDV